MTKTELRTFRVLQGLYIPPRSVIAGPGATHMRLRPGDQFQAVIDRSIRGRIAAGDLVEVLAAPPAPLTKEIAK